MLRLSHKALVLGAALALAAPARAAEKALPPLDEALKQAARPVLAALRAKGYKNVGVLKFLARNEGGPLRDNFGPINRTLPDRLEVAMLLALKPEDNLGVIARASDTVAKSGNLRATHLTESGRERFFRFKPSPFRLAWDDKTAVQPDAFLTGEATLSKDLKRLDVQVQVFTGEGADRLKLQDVTRVAAAVDARTLAECGVTFAGRSRGVGDDDIDPNQRLLADNRPTLPNPADTRDEWATKTEMTVKQLRELPLQIEIVYGTEKAEIKANPFRPPSESDNVFLRVQEPGELAKTVTFRLRNTDSVPYGVVLKVNGQNTIFREEKEDLECYKWLVGPGKTVEVKGFQVDAKNFEPFKVMNDAESRAYESKAGAVNYASNVGTFSVTVFRTASTARDRTEIVKREERDEETRIIGRGAAGVPGGIPASDLASFQSELRKAVAKDRDAAGSRGLLGSGGEGANPVKEEAFKPVPTPVFAATIRYYDLRGK